MRNTDQSSGLFWLIVGIGIAISSLKYGFGTLHEPGPGFITFFAGAILTLLSLSLFLFSFRDQKDRSGFQSLWARLDPGKVLYVIVLLVAYTLLIKPMGFLISTFFLLSLLFRIKGTYRLKTVFLMSFLVTMGSYIIFEIWLKAQLPKGVLGF
jgi:putative tricarboxylic transport membrane protein